MASSAAAGSSSGTAACNEILSTTTAGYQYFIDASAPAATGGQIQSGVYNLAYFYPYTGAGGNTGLGAATVTQSISITGGTMQSVRSEDGGAEQRFTSTITTAGATLSMTRTCGGTGTQAFPYSAGPGSLMIDVVEGQLTTQYVYLTDCLAGPCPSGCCNLGTCVPGDTADMCGSDGNACQACATFEMCGTAGCALDPDSRWDITVDGADFLTTTAAGNAWDTGGGAPDPKACWFDDVNQPATTCTAELQDTFAPVWGTVVKTDVPASVLLGATWKLCLYDVDVVSDDTVGCSQGLTEDVLRGSGCFGEEYAAGTGTLGGATIYGCATPH